jgi:4-hydroxy-tetrahydrodipicolinate synthase
MKFIGAMTAMITPFRDGKVDEARLREQIEFQIQNGIEALVPVGTTGESPTLDFKEHVRVIELTIRHANGRVPIIAGVGANATSEAIELHRAAKDLGADAGLSVNPYYNKPTQEGLYRHFMTLAEAVDLPIVLYNIPGRTGITMSPQTVARLFKEGHAVAIKEATGSFDIATEIQSLCEIPILSGDDFITVPLMSIGVKGAISVVSNLLPATTRSLTQHALDGDFAAARKIHHSMFPLLKALFADGSPAGIKCAMSLAGRDSGELRLPLVPVSAATRQALQPLVSSAAK